MIKLITIVLIIVALFPLATEPQVTSASCTYAIVLWDNAPSFVDFETDGGLWLKPKTGLTEIVSAPLPHEWGIWSCMIGDYV